MVRGRYCYREVLPFLAMVTVEVTNVGLSTIFKLATSKGLDYHVFMVYSYAIATLLLFPIAFFFHRKTVLPPLTISLAFKLFLLGVLGFTAQLLGYKGIEFASPTLGSAMSNLTPACTFVFAILLRMEKLDFRRISSQAKIIGTIVSISGALVVVLYKGPTIINTVSPAISLNSPFDPLSSSQSNWVIGGGLLAADYVIVSIWYIMQAKVVKEYPAELLVVFFYSLSSTIISAPVCLIMEPNLSAWKLKVDIGLIAILYSGIVGSSFGISVHTWGLHVKGPVYVALFRPLSIAIAAVMGVIFLGDALYLGSVVGAIIISFGFYTVMWAKTREDMGEEFQVSNQESPSTTEHAPLLKGYTTSTIEDQSHSSA
ncbi:hypothetical protein LguiA_018586 [Lonicera macranthoides]